MTKSLKNVKNEKLSLQDLEYGEKPEKGGKFRNVNCRTLNIARKLKIMENEKNPLDELKNDEITEKREK